MVSMACVPAFSQTQGPDIWMKLYNEKDLTGWKGVPNYWKVDTGGMVTANTRVTYNTFLASDSLYSDFHFKAEGRMPGTGGYRNSGLMYRATILSTTTYAMRGYQYDLANGSTGGFYHEQGNPMEMGFVGAKCPQGGPSDWKKMEIIANGPKVSHLLGGASCFEYSTLKVTAKGMVGLQMHFPGDFTVNFRNIFIKPLNNSFQIPPDNAWDGTGKKIVVSGIIIAKKREGSPTLGISASVLGYDAQGRMVPAGASKRLPSLVLIRP